jgi:hypothetical protein
MFDHENHELFKYWHVHDRPWRKDGLPCFVYPNGKPVFKILNV